MTTFVPLPHDPARLRRMLAVNLAQTTPEPLPHPVAWLQVVAVVACIAAGVVLTFLWLPS